MSKVRTNDGYKDIEAVYAGSIPIDAIYDKNGNVLFSVYNEVEGLPPLNFKSKANNSSALNNYRIYGNTVSGESVGDKTGNLWDENYPDIAVNTVKYISLSVENGEYTISTNMPLSGSASLFLLSGVVISGASTKDNGVWLEHNQTVTVSDNFITIGYRIYSNTAPRDYSVMLNSGSTALPYEPYGYRVPVKIKGKNLFDVTSYPFTENKWISGMTGTISNDDGFSATLDYIPCVNLTGSFTLNKGPGGTYPGIAFYDSNHEFISGKKNAGIPKNTPFTFDIPENASYFRFTVAKGATDIQIERGIKATAYEPYQTPTTTNLYLPEQIKMVGDESEYIDYSEQKQYRVRKNLLQQTTITSATQNGVTFTVNQDYSVTCNGQTSENLTATLYIPCYLYANETYKLTGTPQNTNGQVQLDMRDASGTLLRPLIYDNTGNGVIFSVNSSGDYKCGIRISPNYNCENITFYPMIRRAEIADGTYEPYITDTALAVTLPSVSIPSGTNTLSVETEVQPSKVYLKGKIEEIPTRTVSYYSQDGSTLLGTETVESDGNASGLQDTPTKPDTEQYTYTFVGWSNTTNATTATSGILNNIIEDKSVYAAFSETEKTFTVTFYNGAELIYTAQNVSYNGTAVYGGATPTKSETSEYTYTFAGWNANSSASTADADALTNVTADRTVYAIFTAAPKDYTVYFYNGETLLETVTGVPNGGTATYTGATPTSSQAGYIFSGWSPSNTNITADTSCYAQFKEDEMYESITDTWSEIIANVSNGTYSTKYHIGDTKKIDLGTEGEVIMQIVGIDADDLADNSGKAPITWISKQLLKASKAMNDTSTNYLSDWTNCDMRTYLKNTVLPMLPSVVQNNIKEVTKYTNQRTGSATFTTISSTEDIWLPSYREISNNASNCETSGVQYNSIFTDNASRVKSKVGKRAYYWWTRSASGDSRSGYSYYFAYVINGGGAYYTGDRCTNSYGVAIGFCT